MLNGQFDGPGKRGRKKAIIGRLWALYGAQIGRIFANKSIYWLHFHSNRIGQFYGLFLGPAREVRVSGLHTTDANLSLRVYARFSGSAGSASGNYSEIFFRRSITPEICGFVAIDAKKDLRPVAALH